MCAPTIPIHSFTGQCNEGGGKKSHVDQKQRNTIFSIHNITVHKDNVNEYT